MSIPSDLEAPQPWPGSPDILADLGGAHGIGSYFGALPTAFIQPEGDCFGGARTLAEFAARCHISEEAIEARPFNSTLYTIHDRRDGEMVAEWNPGGVAVLRPSIRRPWLRE